MKEPGIVAVLCEVHVEEVSYIIVLSTHVYSILNGNGTFTLIDDLPEEFEIKLWRPRKPIVIKKIRNPAPEDLPINWEMDD